METQERWPDGPLCATYEHYHSRLLPNQLISEYCDDNITIAFGFLSRQNVETSLPSAQSSSDTIPHDDRSIVWLAAAQEELYKLYPDEWILVERATVVAHSADPLELQEIAEKQGITTAFMARVAPPSKRSRSIYAR
jgi:hypothetical protein